MTPTGRASLAERLARRDARIVPSREVAAPGESPSAPEEPGPGPLESSAKPDGGAVEDHREVKLRRLRALLDAHRAAPGDLSAKSRRPDSRDSTTQPHRADRTAANPAPEGEIGPAGGGDPTATLRARMDRIREQKGAGLRNRRQRRFAAAPRGPAHERTDHDYPLDAPYGRKPLAALRTTPAARIARLHAEDGPGVDPARALYLDTETSGLAGGTGTFAFLIGVGYAHGDAFRVTQFRMRSPAGERALLEDLAGLVGPRPELVTYNGAAFDLPLLETRYTIHRLPNPFAGAPHLDLLPPARRLFRPRHERAGLMHLERELLGILRDDDIPGSQIPGVFFASLRDGDHPAMESVIEHNRYDIRSLAALTLAAADRLESGWDSDSGEDLVGVARHLSRRGEQEDATGLLERALAAGLAGTARDRCLLQLGFARRRKGDLEGAAAHFSAVRAADTPEWLQALEMLAKFSEHAAKDYGAALLRVEDALDRVDRLPDEPPDGASRRREDWKRREARLRKKIG